MLENFFPLYRYIRGIIIAVLPILLVLFSIGVRLPDAKLHKDTLKNSSFYTELSGEVKNYDPGFDPKNAFLSLVIASTVDQFASPGWLQNFSEQNIDLTSAWLRGDVEDWSFYIPSQDVSLAVNDKIDAKTKGFVDKYGSSVNTCTDTEEVELKNQGFDPNKTFCLPKSVKDGKQTLSSFFGYDQNNSKNKSLLDSLFKNGFWNGNIENFKFDSVFQSSSSDVYKWLKTIRGYFVGLRIIILPALLITILAIAFLILLSSKVGKKPLAELRRVLTYSAYSTIIISVCVILIIGGSAYLTSTIRLALLPGFSTAKIASIVTWQIVLFSFNIVSTAIYIATALFVISLILWVVDKIGFVRKIKLKNEKLATKPTNNIQNRTLDGQFQRATVAIDPATGQEFQNNDEVRNFEMPVVGIRPDYKSVTFNYDAIAAKNQTALPPAEPARVIEAVEPVITSVTYTDVTPPVAEVKNDDYDDYSEPPQSSTNSTEPPTPPKKNITWF